MQKTKNKTYGLNRFYYSTGELTMNKLEKTIYEAFEYYTDLLENESEQYMRNIYKCKQETYGNLILLIEKEKQDNE